MNDRDRAFYLKRWAKYFRLRDKVIQQTRILKSQYLKAAISDGNACKMWSAIKGVSRVNKCRPAQSSLFHADEFADFFSGPQLGDASVSDVKDDVISECPSQAFSIHDVERELLRLRNKSSGPHEIPAWIFHDFSFIFF